MEISTMASGHFSLELKETQSWETFPNHAEQFIETLGGKVESKHDTSGIRLWKVTIQGIQLDLVFDDFPDETSLESSSDEGDQLLQRILEASVSGIISAPPSTN